MTLKSGCRTFQPNIFNRRKCQECFKTRENHLAESFENKPATRKSQGYLFVAPPDVDFSLLINRTKRWQRRWFSLYDDGLLTYALDEHPETVPQATIDMNRAIEVFDAEELTGNSYTMGIRCPETVHFIKGTSTKEKTWWFEVLARYPKLTNRKSWRSSSATINGQTPNKPVLWLYLAANLALESNKQNSKQNELNAERRNWINSNLNETLKGLDVEDLKKCNVRLENARCELKSMRKELNESYANYDYLEMAFEKLKKEMLRREEIHDAEICLMKQRINDLSGKLSISEKNYKEVKHKVTKYELRQERRRSSLKMKEVEQAQHQQSLTTAGVVKESVSNQEKRCSVIPVANHNSPRVIRQTSAYNLRDATTVFRDAYQDNQRRSLSSSFVRSHTTLCDNAQKNNIITNNERDLTALAFKNLSYLRPSTTRPLVRLQDSKYKRCSNIAANQGLLRSPSCPGLDVPSGDIFNA